MRTITTPGSLKESQQKMIEQYRKELALRPKPLTWFGELLHNGRQLWNGAGWNVTLGLW